ncbi:GIY-YIG nuclease family protein [Actinacidiphila sp. ITFR-21]|uniref:GIY-YIG nuclease family protein n=1 Tax=Actinacidiphila sp. ITFR-21 TaxID=3075199 RepID=UPI00288B48A4|nr:GIY-YIG nuclease family protein [Streptomyces sp. ITFR-21]WNI20333.1 GIY-YIG nuclease family protein [Streptomyces sp. ITFR-21]
MIIEPMGELVGMDPVHRPARPFDPHEVWHKVVTAEERAIGWGGLYRFYDADRSLLYVGKTWDYLGRFTAHRHKSQWWYQARYVALSYYLRDCTGDVRLAEIATVSWARPAFNKNFTALSPKFAERLRPHVAPDPFEIES